MSLADELKQENTMADVFAAVPDFRNRVKSSIKTYGRASILHGTHINRINYDGIPERYVRAVDQWARTEGLRVEYAHNSYGVGLLRLSV